MKRRNHSVVAFSIILAATLSCNSQRPNSADRVLERFYPGLRIGMRLSEVRQAYPNLRFQSYYGFVADTPSDKNMFNSIGVKVAATVQKTPPSARDRVIAFHLFSDSGKSGIEAERAVTQALKRSPEVGCGGQSMAIRVWHWSPPGRSIALLHNPRTADGKELVVLMISSRRLNPGSLVTDYAPEPCKE
jgi:hypothetical protein